MTSVREQPPIVAIEVYKSDDESGYYCVGYLGVNHIESFTKPGMYSDIPYVRVWKNGQMHSEYCQHNILAVYFEEEGEQRCRT